MDPKRDAVIVMLSTDDSVIDKARRLWADRDVRTLYCVSSPDDLLLRLISSLVDSDGLRTTEVSGVLLDMTTPTPMTLREPAGGNGDKAVLDSVSEFTQYVSTFLASFGVSAGEMSLPSLLVITNDDLAERMEQMGIGDCSFIAAHGSDELWIQAFETHCRPCAAVGAQSQHRWTLAVPSANAIPLRDGLWFDSMACELLRDGQYVTLTGREGALLATLLQAPHIYLSTAELARRLTRPDAPYPVEEHSIEQTITGLRRKLGEPTRHPQLLRSRRGVGYGIFPQVRRPSQAPLSLVSARKPVNSAMSAGQKPEDNLKLR